MPVAESPVLALSRPFHDTMSALRKEWTNMSLRCTAEEAATEENGHKGGRVGEGGACYEITVE